VHTQALSDEALAERARGGDAAAFGVLAKRFQVPLFHFLCRRASRADAEDLLQETFLLAYTHLAKYQPGRPFRTWLFTIAYRLSLNHRRGLRRALSIDHGDTIVADDPNAQDKLETEETTKQIWDTVRKFVTDKQFAILWLHFVEDLALHEVARVVGRRPIAVRAMLFRARRTLKRCLEADKGTQWIGLTASPPRPATRGSQT
jgi:RNA polymerase sigma-70 factor (ECF subfamily)